MTRFCRIVLAAAAAAFLVPAADAAAQVRLGVKGGPTFPVGHLSDEVELGYHVGAFGTLTPAGLPVDLRLEGAFHRFPEKDEDNHFRSISGALNAVLNLGMGNTRPYLIGGLGVYNSGFGEDEHDHGDTSTTNIGANLGAGVSFQLPGLGIFIETRFHNLFTEGEATRFVPLSFGFRF